MENEIIKLMARGYTQSEIAERLQKNKLPGSSLSSIEKKLKLLRKSFGAKTNFHLAVILKEKELI